MLPFGRLLKPTLKRLHLLREYNQKRAIGIWNEVVEPELRAYTNPRKVKNGVLYISTPSDTWAAQFSMKKHIYLKELNKKLTGNELHDIKFTVSKTPAIKEFKMTLEEKPPWLEIPLGEVEKKELKDRLSEVEDPELRKKLAKLLDKELRFRIWKKSMGWKECKDCKTLVEKGNRCPFCQIRLCGRLR
ncbi:MAG: DUF721 domain-containing protein [Candidatus Eremiobacteraeota bacterium]|nr:DUF721 domain-containing protein [Candidatus Eremiobacteraeota bacterium]